jgi:hypothetical protein
MALPNREICWRVYPYGAWIQPDGAVVAFNRRYRPIARIGSKAEGGLRTTMRGDEWINFTFEGWLYREPDLPWRSRAVRKVCEFVLREFGLDPREALAEARADIAAERSGRRKVK